MLLALPDADHQSGLTLTLPRRVRSGRFGSVVTFFASRKNHGHIACHTLLEADFCIHLEHRSDIVSYQAQPFVMHFKDADLRYTPDFLATLRDGRQVLYEIKSEVGAKAPHWFTRRGQLEALLSQHGWCYEWIVAKAFQRPVYVENLRYLYHHGFAGHISAIRPIIRLLNQSADQEATLDQLLAWGASQAALALGLFNQMLITDLQQPINRLSKVRENDDAQQLSYVRG